MSNIVDLSELTPHIHTTDPVTRNVHVFPVSLLRDLSNGNTEFSNLENSEEALRSIIYMLVDRIDDEINNEKQGDV